MNIHRLLNFLSVSFQSILKFLRSKLKRSTSEQTGPKYDRRLNNYVVVLWSTERRFAKRSEVSLAFCTFLSYYNEPFIYGVSSSYSKLSKMPIHPEVLWAQRSSETEENKVRDPVFASDRQGKLTVFCAISEHRLFDDQPTRHHSVNPPA